MKKIGLLGGTSWISTIEYYRTINRLVSAAMGGFYSARVVVHSINYEPLKSQYVNLEHNTLGELLWGEAEQLMVAKPDCFVLCNNALHEFFDFERFQEIYDAKVFSVPDLTVDYLAQRSFDNVLLLGTRNTMTRQYYRTQFARSGAKVHVPESRDIDAICDAQMRVSKGDLTDAQLSQIKVEICASLEKYSEFCDAIVLACTELPLIINRVKGLDIIDPAYLQCAAAVEFALSDLV